MLHRRKLTSPARLAHPRVMGESRVLVLEQESISERGEGFVGGHLDIELAVGGHGEALAFSRRVVEVSMEPPGSIVLASQLRSGKCGFYQSLNFRS